MTTTAMGTWDATEIAAGMHFGNEAQGRVNPLRCADVSLLTMSFQRMLLGKTIHPRAVLVAEVYIGLTLGNIQGMRVDTEGLEAFAKWAGNVNYAMDFRRCINRGAAYLHGAEDLDSVEVIFLEGID